MECSAHDKAAEFRSIRTHREKADDFFRKRKESSIMAFIFKVFVCSEGTNGPWKDMVTNDLEPCILRNRHFLRYGYGSEHKIGTFWPGCSSSLSFYFLKFIYSCHVQQSQPNHDHR